MNTTLIAMFFSFLLIVLFAGLAKKFSYIKNVYFMGVALWSEWLPVFATTAYMAILASNIVSGSAMDDGILNLTHFFTYFELVALFVLGPCFFLRFGNMVGLGVVLFIAMRLYLANSYGAPSTSLYLITGAATLVAILGDKMPWHTYKASPIAHQVRELLISLFTLIALCITVFSLLKTPELRYWIYLNFGVTLRSSVIMLILVSMALGWTTIALGITRHFMLPLLSLPVVFVLAFLTSWPAHILIIPFAICLALSLSIGERRIGLKRGGKSYTVSLLMK